MGVALCLSGGGYRSVLFHLGALWRLNETGWLPRLNRISSVSSGSIVAGLLGLRWSNLDFDDSGCSRGFQPLLVEPLRELARDTLDVYSIVVWLMSLGLFSSAGRVADKFDRHLYSGATLQDLPEAPEFVLVATSMQTGGLWRFSRAYMGEYRLGTIANPRVSLAQAVAASCIMPAFPPLRLSIDPAAIIPGTAVLPDRQRLPSDILLTDGAVVDRMALETAWKRSKTILVSDGIGDIRPTDEPMRSWVPHVSRVISLMDEQAHSIQKRQLIESFAAQTRQGAYWGIDADLKAYPVSSGLKCSRERTRELAEIPTRFAALEDECQERLINWGYAICDAALRSHVDPSLPAPTSFPYPARGV